MENRLKNYTTGIKVEKTIAQIEKILSTNGANSIYKMYDNDGNVSSIAFKIFLSTIEKDLAFQLPMEEKKVLHILEKSGIQNKYKNIEQARRTGWRIILNWIESQMALLQIKIVTFEQVFLPYMTDGKTTLYEKLEKQNFNFQLEYKGE